MKVFLRGVMVEKKIFNTKTNIAQKLDLPRDIVLDMPCITITGDNEISIENHKGVIIFEEKQVKINSEVGFVSIFGNDFEILFMGGSTITIGGKFKSVVYESYE